MGFFSKIFGGDEGGLASEKKLSRAQQRSLKLMEKKSKKVLKKSKSSKMPQEIAKKLNEKQNKLLQIKQVQDKEIKAERGKKSKKVLLKKVKKEKLEVSEKGKGPKKRDGEVEVDGAIYFKTFVPGFDELVSPGLPAGSAILVEGGPGSGKTLWCLTLLKEMCQREKKVLFMSFEEQEERLRKHINSFGLDTKEYEKKGLLYLKRFNALDIARSVEALLSEAKKELLIDVQPVLIPKEFKPDIVIIDSLSSISSAFSGDPSRFRIYLEQLFRYLEGHEITSFLIREVASPTHIGGTRGDEMGEAVSFLSDGIIAIYNVIYKGGTRKRALEILKMRGVKIDRKICEYDITGKGVIIYPKKVLKGDYTLT